MLDGGLEVGEKLEKFDFDFVVQLPQAVGPTNPICNGMASLESPALVEYARSSR